MEMNKKEVKSNTSYIKNVEDFLEKIKEYTISNLCTESLAVIFEDYTAGRNFMEIFENSEWDNITDFIIDDVLLFYEEFENIEDYSNKHGGCMVKKLEEIIDDERIEKLFKIDNEKFLVLFREY